METVDVCLRDDIAYYGDNINHFSRLPFQHRKHFQNAIFHTIGYLPESIRCKKKLLKEFHKTVHLHKMKLLSRYHITALY